MMFVPHRRHTYGPLWPVTEIALFIFYFYIYVCRSVVLVCFRLFDNLMFSLMLTLLPSLLDWQVHYCGCAVKAPLQPILLRITFLKWRKVYVKPSFFYAHLWKLTDKITTLFLKNAVLSDVTPCGSRKNWRFGGTCRLLHQGVKNRQARNVSSN
jgi:hypothetical protein